MSKTITPKGSRLPTIYLIIAAALIVSILYRLATADEVAMWIAITVCFVASGALVVAALDKLGTRKAVEPAPDLGLLAEEARSIETPHLTKENPSE